MEEDDKFDKPIHLTYLKTSVKAISINIVFTLIVRPTLAYILWKRKKISTRCKTVVHIVEKEENLYKVQNSRGHPTPILVQVLLLAKEQFSLGVFFATYSSQGLQSFMICIFIRDT